jgi:hypothetical protein
MLLDSNIIIYAAQPQHAHLRAFAAEHVPAVSVVSLVEVLGFHRLQPSDRALFEGFFRAAEILPLSDAVVQQAIRLRQQRKVSLGDSIVAATALHHRRTQVTRNTDDFRWIPDLVLLDPFVHSI